MAEYIANFVYGILKRLAKAYAKNIVARLPATEMNQKAEFKVFEPDQYFLSGSSTSMS